MDFSYSEEQQMLQDSVSRFVQDKYSFDDRRKIVDAEQGYDISHWQMFAELGWLSIPFAEQYGGFGGSASDVMVVMQQFGKGIVVEPFIATTVLSGRILQACDQPELIEQIIDGSKQFAFAYAEAGSRFKLNYVKTEAEKIGDGYVLNGSKAVVLNGGDADHIIVSARTQDESENPDGISLFLVNAGAQGLSTINYKNVDGHGAAEVILNQTPAALLGEQHQALPVIEDALRWATLAVCAEAIGIMETLLRKTIDYTSTRQQFGRPLSKFQALSHRMAEMFIETEQAKSIVMMATINMDQSEDVIRSVSAAKSRVGKAAKKVGQEAVQLHGGIAVTEEFDVGHYFKRLTTIESLFGSSDYHTQIFTKAG